MFLVAEFFCSGLLGLDLGFFFGDRFCVAGCVGPLPDPVVIVTDVFRDLAVTLESNGAGDNVVEEGAVMADKEQGALVVEQQLFQQFQCFYIQVVGGLVHDQHIEGLGKQLGQHQAVAFATGERADRGVGAIGCKQEITEVAHDVF